MGNGKKFIMEDNAFMILCRSYFPDCVFYRGGDSYGGFFIAAWNNGEYLTWSDEDFDKMMFWDYVERYYQIILSEKQREYELENPLHKEFVNKNIIITDPCYIFEDYCKAEAKGVLMRDTIYGDWSCTTYNLETKTEIGKFCADAGMVCVVETDNEMVDYDQLMRLPSRCRTIIENFTGTVYIKRIPTDYEDEIQIIGEGNINFIGTQTGL